MRLVASLFLLTDKIVTSLVHREDPYALDTFLAKPLEEKQAVADQYFNCLADQNCEIGEADKTPCLNCFKDAFDTTNSTIYKENEIECDALCTPAFKKAKGCLETDLYYYFRIYYEIYRIHDLFDSAQYIKYAGKCVLERVYEMYGEDHWMFQNPEMAISEVATLLVGHTVSVTPTTITTTTPTTTTTTPTTTTTTTPTTTIV